MVSVEEAKRLLFASIQKTTVVETDLIDASGRVLGEDIFSPVDLPLFDQSAMDGYAVASDEKNSKQFELVGEIKAGDNPLVSLKNGQAVRIFTGAAVPEKADTVVIQEKVEHINGTIYLPDDFIKGDCIRLKGSQIKRGELALKKGTVLNPAAIGFLAALGIAKIKISRKPDVSIVVTGSEIVMPGTFLKEGQIFESNSFSLHGALMQLNIVPKNIFTAPDEKKELKNQIKKSLSESDVTIITGGVSVGKYDLVYDVLQELEIETIFHKVTQKPGKPLLCGKLKDKLIFALPGNPAAVLVCFYEYIYPSVRMIQGFENITLPSVKLKLMNDIAVKEDRSLFLRGKKMKDEVMSLEKQDSNMLRSFAEADVLIYVPNQTRQLKAGYEVEVHLLPFNN